MMKTLRSALKQFVEIAAPVVLGIDLVLGFGLLWFSSRLKAERDLLQTLQAQVTAQQAAIKRLEQRRAKLPETQGQLRLFLENRVPSHREGSARATRLIWLLKQKSNVQLDGVTYKPVRAEDEPLQHLAAEVSLEGPFADLINFAHALETASDFVLVRSLSMAPGEGGKLALHLNADFYIAP